MIRHSVQSSFACRRPVDFPDRPARRAGTGGPGDVASRSRVTGPGHRPATPQEPAISDAPATPPALPPLHAAWLVALTGVDGPPSEPRATCGDCVMCAGVARSGTRVTFSPDVACCDYVPHLANVLTGRALAGPGRAGVLARIGRRTGVTPLGLGLTQDDVRRMVAGRADAGRATGVRCPHLDTAARRCTVWETRNAVCSTWFCRHERGAVGRRFWQAARDLLIAVEEEVALRRLHDGGLPPDQVRAVVAHREAVRATVRRANAGQGPVPAADDASPQWYARMWGGWQGREEEWFTRCAAPPLAVDPAALPHGVRALADDVRRCWADLADRRVPDRLTFTPGPGTEATEDVLRLFGYSPFDPVVLPAELEPALWLLDGRPLADVLADAERAGHARPDVDVLRRLHDAGVALAPAPDGGADPAGPSLALDDPAPGRVLVLGPDRHLDLDAGRVDRGAGA